MELLKAYLRTENLTQEEAAKRFGCSQGLVSHLLTGRVRMTVRRAQMFEAGSGGRLRAADLLAEASSIQPPASADNQRVA